MRRPSPLRPVGRGVAEQHQQRNQREVLPIQIEDYLVVKAIWINTGLFLISKRADKEDTPKI